jgi:hypothetical protein
LLGFLLSAGEGATVRSVNPSDFSVRLDRHPALRAALRTDEGLHVAERIALAIRPGLNIS